MSDQLIVAADSRGTTTDTFTTMSVQDIQIDYTLIGGAQSRTSSYTVIHETEGVLAERSHSQNSTISGTDWINDAPAGEYTVKIYAEHGQNEGSSVTVYYIADIISEHYEESLDIFNAYYAGLEEVYTEMEGFEIERKEEGGEWGLLARIKSGVSEFIDADVEPYEIYRYRIRQVRGLIFSDWSNIVTATVIVDGMHYEEELGVIKPAGVVAEDRASMFEAKDVSAVGYVDIIFSIGMGEDLSAFMALYVSQDDMLALVDKVEVMFGAEVIKILQAGMTSLIRIRGPTAGKILDDLGAAEALDVAGKFLVGQLDITGIYEVIETAFPLEVNKVTQAEMIETVKIGHPGVAWVTKYLAADELMTLNAIKEIGILDLFDEAPVGEHFEEVLSIGKVMDIFVGDDRSMYEVGVIMWAGLVELPAYMSMGEEMTAVMVGYIGGDDLVVYVDLLDAGMGAEVIKITQVGMNESVRIRSPGAVDIDNFVAGSEIFIVAAVVEAGIDSRKSGYEYPVIEFSAPVDFIDKLAGEEIRRVLQSAGVDLESAFKANEGLNIGILADIGVNHRKSTAHIVKVSLGAGVWVVDRLYTAVGEELYVESGISVDITDRKDMLEDLLAESKIYAAVRSKKSYYDYLTADLKALAELDVYKGIIEALVAAGKMSAGIKDLAKIYEDMPAGGVLDVDISDFSKLYEIGLVNALGYAGVKDISAKVDLLRAASPAGVYISDNVLAAIAELLLVGSGGEVGLDDYSGLHEEISIRNVNFLIWEGCKSSQEIIYVYKPVDLNISDSIAAVIKEVLTAGGMQAVDIEESQGINSILEALIAPSVAIDARHDMSIWLKVNMPLKANLAALAASEELLYINKSLTLSLTDIYGRYDVLNIGQGKKTNIVDELAGRERPVFAVSTVVEIDATKYSIEELNIDQLISLVLSGVITAPFIPVKIRWGIKEHGIDLKITERDIRLGVKEGKAEIKVVDINADSFKGQHNQGNY